MFGPWFVVSFLVLQSSESWLLCFLLSSCSHVIFIILCLFLTVPCVVLQCVTVALPGQTQCADPESFIRGGLTLTTFF